MTPLSLSLLTGCGPTTAASGFKVGTASCFSNSFLLNSALNSWRFWKLSSVNAQHRELNYDCHFQEHTASVGSSNTEDLTAGEHNTLDEPQKYGHALFCIFRREC